MRWRIFTFFPASLEDEIGEIIAQHTDNTGIEEILILIISGAFDGNETHSTATEMAVISGTLWGVESLILNMKKRERKEM